MKSFIVSVLTVAIFFLGLGALVEKTGARFKSDEKALELVRKARIAIGGDAAIAGVQGLRIVGQTTRTVKIDGVDRMETGETEIALQMPDKVMRMMKIGKDDGSGTAEKFINKQVDVVVVGDGAQKVRVDADAAGTGSGVKKIVIKKDDGTEQVYTGAEAEKIIAADGGQSGDNVKKIVIKKGDGTVEEMTGPEADKVIVRTVPGDKGSWTTDGGKTIKLDDKQIVMRHADAHAGIKQNELLRLTLGLLLTAPQGMDVSYTFGGEGSVDGTSCNIVNAEFAGSTYRIYLSQSSNLPVMMSYKGMPMPKVMAFRVKDGNAAPGAKSDMVFERKMDAPAMVDYSVKFTDYRSVGGLQLPYKWTQTVGGNADEVFDVSSYEVNPANIADTFKDQKVMVRVAKPENK